MQLLPFNYSRYRLWFAIRPVSSAIFEDLVADGVGDLVSRHKIQSVETFYSRWIERRRTYARLLATTLAIIPQSIKVIIITTRLIIRHEKTIRNASRTYV